MAHGYHDIAFTPTILDIQAAEGSRDNYAAMGAGGTYNHALTEREAGFIAMRDSFYMASVSETGWPYLQHRGGPAGFMKVLDERTLGFADYSGNRQYVSTGNFHSDDRVSLFFMDYPKQRRLKLFGRVRIIDAADRAILDQLRDGDYPARVERGFLVDLEGFDWNCPQHITPRYSEAEVDALLHGLREEVRGLRISARDVDPGIDDADVLGSGPLDLVITGLRQLAPRVRAYELRDPAGRDLPAIEPGSHLLLPVRLPGGELTDRHYSIASNPARRDAYEVAVQEEPRGRGGSVALHQAYRLGLRLRAEHPANHFPLHTDDRAALLIAGGIGITPIKSMAQALEARGSDFELHYAGRSAMHMPYLGRLQRQFGHRLSCYSSADGQRLDLRTLLDAAPDDAVIYVCGPDRLVAGVQQAGAAVGIDPERVRLERFN